jgi:hypothetical protein
MPPSQKRPASAAGLAPFEVVAPMPVKKRVTCISRCEQISSSNTLSEAPSNLITMAWCSLQALSTPDTSKTISTYLDCKDVLAARRTCHLMEPLPLCLPNLLPGQRCPCFWQSPEWLCTLMNKSTKVPHTILRWPIARACDNLVGPIYPLHKLAFDMALFRRWRLGLWPRVRGYNGLTDQLHTRRTYGLEMLEFMSAIEDWVSYLLRANSEEAILIHRLMNRPTHTFEFQAV